jgi:lysine 2,3-aminomutase
MDKHQSRLRLLNILNTAPPLREILLSGESIQMKRENFYGFLSRQLTASIDSDTPHSLEWILTREAVQVFWNLLSPRSERLAGFSLFEYLNDLLEKDRFSALAPPTADFFAELEHLVRGVMGCTNIYPRTPPAYTKYEGKRAAKLRSADLSRMARGSKRFTDRYACGLENDIIRRRSRNRSRILQYFNATGRDWERWKWHTRNIIRDPDTLKALVELRPQEYEAVHLARQHKLPFGITPYYLSLMDRKSGSPFDRAIRAQVIPSLHYIRTVLSYGKHPEISQDFMLEHNTSPIEGITRRYPKIVIIKPVLTCPQICVYCQRNWEIEDVYSPGAALDRKTLNRAISWIADTPEINEVLITGGDPLILSNAAIEGLLLKLSRIPHLERIRIGTRTPVTLPQRITASLVDGICRFHRPGKLEVMVVTHFEHPYEITPQAMAAIQQFKRRGMDVYNQLVYTYFNSRRFEAVVLRHRLKMIGVSPYYTFNTKGKEETKDFRVPIARLLQEQKEEARLQPGSVRTDEIVFNVPGLGKNYLRARQHHDVISILPDGRRVYEFHPWEKKLALADTYIYKDVSIYQYLKRLRADGENLSDYRTIWYYY